MEHIFFNYSDIIEEIADRYELKNLSEKTFEKLLKSAGITSGSP